MGEHAVRHNRPVLNLDISEKFSHLASRNRRDVALAPSRQNVSLEDALDLAPRPIVGLVLWYVPTSDATVMLQNVIGHNSLEKAMVALKQSFFFKGASFTFRRLFGCILRRKMFCRVDPFAD